MVDGNISIQHMTLWEIVSTGSQISVTQEYNRKTFRVTGIPAGIVRSLGRMGEQLELVIQRGIYSNSLEGAAWVLVRQCVINRFQGF